MQCHSLLSLINRHMRHGWRGVLLVFSLVVFTACAAYTPPPLTMAHPAHLEAMAAPEPPPSTTLAYGPSDVPSPRPAFGMAQREAPRAQASESDQGVVEGEGKVVAVVPSSSQIVVDHKAIKGFMAAMTMGYQVASPALLKGLKAGDHIRFTIRTQEKVIVNIEKMAK
jgi:Cu/Ag efflux protein CusF